MKGIVSIEGNLGAGKTTLLNLLNVQVLKEPVEQWQNLAGINLLKKYYENPKRWAFTFQLHALESRITLWNKTIAEEPTRLHFAERSPTADRYIFGEIQAKENNMDAAEYMIYTQLSKLLMEKSLMRAVIYLKCSPKKCLERLKKRGREGENTLSLEYIEKVHNSHQQWVHQINGIPVLTIDTEVYNIYDKKDQIQILKLMNSFIKNLGHSEEKVQFKQNLSLIEVSSS